jgi:hypothetical protein
MDTNALKKFAQSARNLLINQVASKLDLVLDPASPVQREHPKAMKALNAAIARDGKRQVIEQVAYTWFNRFTALRFMDVNGYTTVGVVTPTGDQTRPELLAEAMAGNLPEGAPGSIAALLDGRTPSSDPQAEAYRQLLVHACNQWHGPMPFLFEQIDDYTELLMPEDLLSQTSILAELRKVMTEDACRDVEIIGWLYQFYISEKKDQVFAGLKKNQKITAENIPAATQLFTPHWIVRYLVENSLGRLWLLNRPHSRLAERMDYYIAPEEPETDFLRIARPEDIRICDPAAGSGHMLTYAFDLLYAIYEEEGYDATEIPALILTHNLTGVEIDDRAGALAAFALAMKAAAKLGRRRFLRMQAKPDICVLQNVSFTETEVVRDVAAVVGRDLFTAELRETLGQFEQAKNFGSLIVPKLRDPAEALRVVEARDFGGDLLLKEVQARAIALLRMAEALSPKYHVVVANPPYMGARNINKKLLGFLTEKYESVKFDTFSAFSLRSAQMTISEGYTGIMSPNVWMYISNHEGLRVFLTKYKTIETLVELPLTGFSGATVQICAFVFQNAQNPEKLGTYISLTGFKGGDDKMSEKAKLASNGESRDWIHRVSTKEFEKIPGRPFAYWTSEPHRSAFKKYRPLAESSDVRTGMQTGDNPRFLRFWHEISSGAINPPADIYSPNCRWYLYAKGGDYRLWYGNIEHVVDWKSEGFAIKNLKVNGSLRSRVREIPNYFRNAASWSFISSSYFGCRYKPPGVFFDVAGSSALEKSDNISSILGFLCSSVASNLLSSMNPTMNFQIEDIASLPFHQADARDAVNSLIEISRSDWDAYETSWDFTTLPLVQFDHRAETLEGTYTILRSHWQGMTDEMQRLEEENNRIFIDAYGLQEELTADVSPKGITLTCNPAYRYGIKNDVAANEARLRADTMAEFLSYAVGCMFGRYSLDTPSLILANQGETLADYLARVPDPTFMPDEDNVIPVLDADWFPDDITERFRLFLRTTFGEAHFRENLRYIEDALGKDIRKYFTKDFYADHVKRYKKRPIYWMVSSPKGTFQALMYMHRYRGDTVSVILNDYLREFISKLQAERGRLEKLSDDPSASQGQRTKALKDMAVIAKQIDELNEWERDIVFPLAQAKTEIDLDDGVKANYPKFGAALKKIPGLEAKDD